MPGTNKFNQPVGEPLLDWRPAQQPVARVIQGEHCRLEKLTATHLEDLYEAFGQDDGRMWTYMPAGPFATKEEFALWLRSAVASEDPCFYAIVSSQDDRALGCAAFMRLQPAVGVIEIGSIAFAPSLQRTILATEAMFLFMRHAFETLGYRRYEWKCDSLNAASRAAALRLGFTYEGLFRQALVYKSRNRDTAWFSVLDSEWPELKLSFEAWLGSDNFDATGRQIKRLQDFRGTAQRV